MGGQDPTKARDRSLGWAEQCHTKLCFSSYIHGELLFMTAAPTDVSRPLIYPPGVRRAAGRKQPADPAFPELLEGNSNGFVFPSASAQGQAECWGRQAELRRAPWSSSAHASTKRDPCAGPQGRMHLRACSALGKVSTAASAGQQRTRLLPHSWRTSASLQHMQLAAPLRAGIVTANAPQRRVRGSSLGKTSQRRLLQQQLSPTAKEHRAAGEVQGGRSAAGVWHSLAGPTSGFWLGAERRCTTGASTSTQHPPPCSRNPYAAPNHPPAAPPSSGRGVRRLPRHKEAPRTELR